MKDRSKQPAVLLRRIKQLEAQLAAEQEASAKAWEGYRDVLYKNVDLSLKLEAVERALRGES